jgi:uncharacterized repeat protein (TIGR02543 family)
VANITSNIAANQTITLGGSNRTVGTLNVGDTTDGSHRYTITGSTLIFDATSGSAQLNVLAGAGAQTTFIHSIVRLDDDLVITINQASAGLGFVNNAINQSGGDRTLTLTSTVASPGSSQFGTANGFTKLVVSGNAIFNNTRVLDDRAMGRVLASFTADAITLDGGILRAGRDAVGLQTHTVSTNRGITLGAGGGTLNGSDSERVWVVNSVITGSGALNITGLGSTTLNAVNTYAGDTNVTGTLIVTGGNAIPDTGKLVINTGGKVNPSGTTEIVAALFFGTEQQASGTWGATGSGATNINDTYFTGTGVVSVIQAPELITTYTVSYNANGGTGSIAPATKTENEDLILSDGSGFARSGFTFAGWNTSADGSGTDYNAGASYAENADVTLYAKWTKSSFTVAFNGDGSTGNIEGAGEYTTGSTATLTAVPQPGYVFTGWTGDASGTQNPLAIVVDSDLSIGASFAPDTADADRDGLDNHDEIVVYGTNPDQADTDGDGLSDGWELGVGRFSIVTGSFTWQQARDDARSKGGDLASFPTEDRWNRAMQGMEATALDEFTGLWIGASDAALEGSWTWVNGEAFSYTRWGTGRPSATAGNTLDYVEVSGGAGAEIGQWYDRSPATLRDGYLLERGYPTNPLVADSDGDGLSDGEELAAGSHPLSADTDGDGLSDWEEVRLTGTNPSRADTDGNGISDADEDADGDGLANIAEIRTHATDPLRADTDGDGLSDGFEVNQPVKRFVAVAGGFTHSEALADAQSRGGNLASFPNLADYQREILIARKNIVGNLWIGLSDEENEGVWKWLDGTVAAYGRWFAGQPDGGTNENHALVAAGTNEWADSVAVFEADGYLLEIAGLDPLNPDTDGDGLTDGDEVNIHNTDPLNTDSDGDGLTDGDEINLHTTNPLGPDTDGDGLTDGDEVRLHLTNPTLKDSDGDGFDDKFEILTGFNPNSPQSTPDALSTIRTAVEFRFNAANGISYRIEASTDLKNWEMIETDIIGQSGVVTRFYSIENQPKRYFRVRRN